MKILDRNGNLTKANPRIKARVVGGNNQIGKEKARDGEEQTK